MAGQTEWPANKVRSTFNKYFEDNGHVFVPSSSTIPHDDPTLLFANAGMNQVKKVFFFRAQLVCILTRTKSFLVQTYLLGYS
jgi:alanyl-tRNA synthetase